jgi:hypothetical protein
MIPLELLISDFRLSYQVLTGLVGGGGDRRVAFDVHSQRK